MFAHVLSFVVVDFIPVVHWHEGVNLQLRASITKGCISKEQEYYTSLRVCRYVI